ncbi:MAG: secondary thiamine-phosphate synthase enzyme YjbQ [Planctomycetota bacterium]|jgi:secondary thiamine-phosphate synthase enzyme
MNHYNETISVKTHRRNEMVDITSEVSVAIAQCGIDTGTVIVFCPHTTAGITINENADPDVTHDILLTLDELLPQLRKGYQHAEGNSDAHVKSSLVGASETIFIRNGRMQLGTWQGVYFCEFDGPRSRQVHLHITG